MKTKLSITSGLYLCAIASFIVCGCKGKDGATGPAGVNGTVTTRDTVFIKNSADQKEGYVQGIFTDTTVNNGIQVFNMNFPYSLPTRNSFNYYVSSGNNINTVIAKNDSLGTSNLIYGGNYMMLSFELPDSLIRKGGLLTGPLKGSVFNSLLIKTGENIFSFKSCQGCGDTTEVRDVRYNAVTSVLTGRFFAKFPAISGSSKGASFQGTFSSKMIKINY